MRNLVYINGNGHLGKAAFEVVTYAKKLGGTVTVLATGNMSSDLLGKLGTYGANEVVINRAITGNDDQQIAAWIASQAAGANNMALIKTTPTVCNPKTMARTIKVVIRISINLVLKPKVLV